MTDRTDLEMRPVSDDEFLAWARAVDHHFHDDTSDEDLERYRPVTELDRTLAVFDGARIVANLSVDSFTCTIPGGDPLPCAGVTAVGVAATHRRRGLLTAMMVRCFDEAAQRGEPLAALYASEAPIYGRYGFGVAAPKLSYRLERPWFELVRPGDTGLVEAVEPDDAIARWPAMFEAVRRTRPGMMSLTEAMWRYWLGNDPESQRGGASKRRLVQVPDRGYAVYRVKAAWNGNTPDGTIKLEALVAADPDAEAALWQFLFGIDLMQHLEADGRPADDALPYELVNRDRLQITERMPLYLRLLDVPAALSARGYTAPDTLVLEVHDGLRSGNAGRWRLDAVSERAVCEPTDAPADLELDVAELASLYLGGVRATRLLAARRVVEHTAGAAARADRLFAADVAPWTPFVF